MSADRGSRSLLAASVLSGVSALVLELLWIRELALVAGSTQAAISVVLSVFFLGLALGNAFAARVVRRMRHPLRLYVAAELVIAVWAVAFHPLLALLAPLYASLYENLPPGSPWIHALRLSATGLLLLVPTTAMGTTVPILAARGGSGRESASRWSGRVYGFNTLGAVIGVGLAGFYLVEHFGVRGPLRLSGVLNLAAAALVVPSMRRDAAVSARVEPSRLSRRGVRLLVAFAVLGFANIAAEVLWTRFFAILFHNDTYVFSAILMVYLLGVGAGSLGGAALVRRSPRPDFLLGLTQLCSALWLAGMVWVVPESRELLGPYSSSWGQYFGKYLISVVVGILLPTLCMGLSFPLLVRAALPSAEETSSVVGRALAGNTVGGVLGAGFAGFVLLDRVGLHGGMLLCIVLIGATGVALVASAPDAPRRRFAWAAALASPTLLLLLLAPRLPDSLLRMQAGEQRQRLLATRPSVHGTVAVAESAEGERFLWINNAWVARESQHMAFAYVPWIFHRGEVERGLGICCGTGRTFGALHHIGVPSLDLVEINRSVLDLSRTWFARSNHEVLSSPDVRLMVDDGRNYVRYARESYDLITLEPLQMYQKGVVYFYTEEFYREARARLRPGGVLCQWVPLYVPRADEVRSMVATFVKVFPAAILWGKGPDAVLLGFNVDGTAIDFDEATIDQRVARAEVRKDLVREDMGRRWDIYMNTLLDGPTLARFSAGATTYTDDRPTLEFTAPRGRGSAAENYRQLQPWLTPLSALFQLAEPGVVTDVEQLRDLIVAWHAASGRDEQQRIERQIAAVGARLYPDR